MASLLLLRTTWRSQQCPPSFLYRARFFSTGPKISKPLRILFCGSDSFSVASLNALHGIAKKSPDIIKSINVVCRPPKFTGRGMRVLKDLPIYPAARKLGLRVHETDTFENWNIPRPDGEEINLIIAVSFGLFIPAQIIKAAEYGGLNVHPSMLPDHRGAAPLQRMIMFGIKTTGITLQTLDTRRFDHGIILAQKRLRIPHPTTITYPELVDFMAPEGAELLTKGILQRLYVPPLKEISKDSYESNLPPHELSLAPKIAKEDRLINWHRNDAMLRIDRRHRALGPLYSLIYVGEDSIKRFIFHDFEIVDRPQVITEWIRKWQTGEWFQDKVENHIPEYDPTYVRPKVQRIPIADDANNYESSFEAWQEAGGNKPGQTRDQAYASWVEYRRKRVAQQENPPPKQNVYHMIVTASTGEKVPVFYIDDGDAIIVAVKGAGLRIKEITPEGSTRRPARIAMKLNRKRGMWKLRFRIVGGVDRWSAEFNSRFTDTYDRAKFIENLPPDRRQEEEDKELWRKVQLETKREEKLQVPLAIIQDYKRREEAYKEEEKKVRQLRMERFREEIKEKKRMVVLEEARLAKERIQIAEDLKKGDWSDLLVDRRHADFFPEAFAKARLARLQEKDKKIKLSAKELANTDPQSNDQAERAVDGNQQQELPEDVKQESGISSKSE